MSKDVETVDEAHLTQEGQTDETLLGHIAEGHQWDDLTGHGVSREGLVETHRFLHTKRTAPSD